MEWVRTTRTRPHGGKSNSRIPLTFVERKEADHARI